MEPFEELRRAFRVTVIASVAIIGALFILAIVVEIIKFRLEPFQGVFETPHGQVVRYIFYGLAVIVVVLLRVFGRVLVRSHQGESPQAFIQRLTRAVIYTASLAEIPALLGFVLFLLIGTFRDFYVLLFVSLFLEFMYFPRIKTWEDMIRNAFPQLKT
jgi:protein-S-isoprenylcysteine O-methyltransferase Ste14